MTQPPAPLPDATVCGFCHRPLGGMVYRALGHPACEECAEHLLGATQLNKFHAPSWFAGLFWGLGAAVLCGFVWAYIVKLTNYEIGIIAAAVGWIVTRAVMQGARGRRGPSVQALTIPLSILGIFLGKGLTAAWALWDQVRPEVTEPGVSESLARAVVFVTAPFLTFRLFDLLWYGFAIYEAWRLPRALKIVVEGPFPADAVLPSAPTTLPSLQFDRVEPGAAPPNPDRQS